MTSSCKDVQHNPRLLLLLGVTDILALFRVNIPSDSYSPNLIHQFLHLSEII